MLGIGKENDFFFFLFEKSILFLMSVFGVKDFRSIKRI